MATTLDIVSGGRLEFGLGSGSIREEHTRAGPAWGAAAERAGRLGEALEIITSMFAHERTTFAGAHYRVDDIADVPGPVQRPRPPIHIGGTGPKYTLPLVARYADVWNIPTYGLPERQRLSGLLDAECERIGRDPATLRRSHQAVLALAADDELPEVRAPGRGVISGRRPSRSTRDTWALRRWWPTGSPNAPHRVSTRWSSWSARNRPRRPWNCSPRRWRRGFRAARGRAAGDAPRGAGHRPLPARSPVRNSAIAAATASGRSSMDSTYASDISIRRAPGISSARRRPCARGMTLPADDQRIRA